MNVEFRAVAIIGGLAVLVAGGLASPAMFPAAFADEPQSHLLDTAKDLFPAPFDMKRLRKFDVTLDDSISTKATRTQTVTKIGYGQKTIVSIVTTPSGTYSSDALTSPNVRYPGISVTPRCTCSHWAYESFTAPWGNGSWTQFSSGSFTYLTYNFTPAKRSRT